MKNVHKFFDNHGREVCMMLCFLSRRQPHAWNVNRIYYYDGKCSVFF